MFSLRAPYAPVLVCADPDGFLPKAVAESWAAWYRQNQQLLCDGVNLAVPATLPRPSQAGFAFTSLAENVGQVRDWAAPISDGSRLHVHEFADGSLRVHRDATDPSRGLTSAVWHWATESTSGRAVVIAAVVLFVGSHTVAMMAK